MLVRKLRLDRGWSQETLAELSGLSVRTIQRIERGGQASLDTRNALAAAFAVDLADLTMEESMIKSDAAADAEREALDYVRDIKGFYSHLGVYVITVAAWLVALFVFDVRYPGDLWWPLGWGLGVAAHGLAVFEVFSLFGAKWERRQVEKRLRQVRDRHAGS